MTTATLDRGDSKTKLKIIDADTHLSEPHDLWIKHAPATLRDRVPQIKEYQGRISWVIDGDKPIGFGGSLCSAVRKDRTKALDVEDFGRLTFDDIHPGSYDLKPRLAEMDRCGIYAQIVYPNVRGFGGQACAKVDPELRLVSVQIYNDAMAEMQENSGLRCFPMALLPWWDVKEAMKETKRAHKMGLRGININSIPTPIRMTAANRCPILLLNTGIPFGKSVMRSTCRSISISAPASNPWTGSGRKVGRPCMFREGVR